MRRSMHGRTWNFRSRYYIRITDSPTPYISRIGGLNISTQHRRMLLVIFMGLVPFCHGLDRRRCWAILRQVKSFSIGARTPQYFLDARERAATTKHIKFISPPKPVRPLTLLMREISTASAP